MQNITIRRVSRQELKREVEIVDLLIGMVLVALAIISLIYYTSLKDKIGSGVETYGAIAIFFISGVMELIPQIFYPGFPMIVAIASGMSTTFAILVTLLGSTVGSLLGFGIGKRYGYGVVHTLFDDEKMFRIEKWVEKYGNFFMTISAVTPLPYMALLFGAFDIKWRDFILFGIVARVLGFIFLGYAVHFGFVSMNL